MSAILGIIISGRWWVESRLKNAEWEWRKIHAEYTMLKKEFELRDFLWVEQKKILHRFEGQQRWRNKFSCQQHWLEKLSVDLPAQCRVERVSVKIERWQLLVLCNQEVDLKLLIQSISFLPGLSDLKVHQSETDEKQRGRLIEFNSILHCE